MNTDSLSNRNFRCNAAGLIFLMLLSGCLTSDFVYQGRVTSIATLSMPASPLIRYKVVTEVTEVIQGDYNRKTCTLTMQDPYLSGLKEGGTYLFHVKREGLSYIPDEFRLKQKLYQ